MDARFLSVTSYHRNDCVAPSKKLVKSNSPIYTITANKNQLLINTYTSAMFATPTIQIMPIRTQATLSGDMVTKNILNQMHLNKLTKDLSLITYTPLNNIHKQSQIDFDDENKIKTIGHSVLNFIKGFFTSLIRTIIQTNISQSHLVFAKIFENINNNNCMNHNSTFDSDSSTFFDCDDYVDNEDAVDFIAKSVPTYSRNEHEDAKSISSEDFSTNEYFDCIEISSQTANIDNKPEFKNTNEKRQRKYRKTSKQNNRHPEISSSNISNRRKRKRKHNKSNRYRSSRSFTPEKNRYEKCRHLLEKDIHDDIDDCMNKNVFGTWVEANESFDIEEKDTINNSMDESNFSENILSNTGSLFSCFIPLNNKPCKIIPKFPLDTSSKSLLRWSSFHHSICDSENGEIDVDETDDGKISIYRDLVFGTPFRSFRERHISECSDDYICFEYDDDGRYDSSNTSTDATDDDLTDTDKLSEENIKLKDETSQRQNELLEHIQPDSGFEEKKVNLLIKNPLFMEETHENDPLV